MDRVQLTRDIAPSRHSLKPPNHMSRIEHIRIKKMVPFDDAILYKHHASFLKPVQL